MQASKVYAVELRQLEAFVAVATELHFGRAAERLHIGQPTVSDLVRRLERELRTPLLTRSARHVALTGAGTELYRRAAAILDEVSAATADVQRFADGEAGSVRVGVTPAVAPVLTTHLAEEMRRDAGGVDLVITRMWLPELEKAIADHDVDVGISFGPIPPMPGVVSETLCGEPFLVGLRTHHRLAQYTVVPLAELAHETLGVPSRELFPSWALAQSYTLGAAGISPKTVELDDVDPSAHKWVTQPEVDWILTTASVATPDSYAVTRPAEPAPLIPYVLHWIPRRTRNPAVSRFVRLARQADVPPGLKEVPDDTGWESFVA